MCNMIESFLKLTKKTLLKDDQSELVLQSRFIIPWGTFWKAVLKRSNHNFYFRARQILKTFYITSFQTTFVSNFTIYHDGWFVKLFAECNYFRISFMSLIEDLKKSAYQKTRLLYVCELSTYKIGLFLFN